MIQVSRHNHMNLTRTAGYLLHWHSLMKGHAFHGFCSIFTPGGVQPAEGWLRILVGCGCILEQAYLEATKLF